jgi:hypothetical protein
VLKSKYYKIFLEVLIMSISEIGKNIANGISRLGGSSAPRETQTDVSTQNVRSDEVVKSETKNPQEGDQKLLGLASLKRRVDNTEDGAENQQYKSSTKGQSIAEDYLKIGKKSMPYPSYNILKEGLEKISADDSGASKHEQALAKFGIKFADELKDKNEQGDSKVVIEKTLEIINSENSGNHSFAQNLARIGNAVSATVEERNEYGKIVLEEIKNSPHTTENEKDKATEYLKEVNTFEKGKETIASARETLENNVSELYKQNENIMHGSTTKVLENLNPLNYRPDPDSPIERGLRNREPEWEISNQNSSSRYRRLIEGESSLDLEENKIHFIHKSTEDPENPIVTSTSLNKPEGFIIACDTLAETKLLYDDAEASLKKAADPSDYMGRIIYEW